MVSKIPQRFVQGAQDSSFVIWRRIKMRIHIFESKLFMLWIKIQAWRFHGCFRFLELAWELFDSWKPIVGPLLIKNQDAKFFWCTINYVYYKLLFISSWQKVINIKKYKMCAINKYLKSDREKMISECEHHISFSSTATKACGKNCFLRLLAVIDYFHFFLHFFAFFLLDLCTLDAQLSIWKVKIFFGNLLFLFFCE